MGNWQDKNICEIMHYQGQMMRQGQSQNREKNDNFGHSWAHLKCFKLSEIIQQIYIYNLSF